MAPFHKPFMISQSFAQWQWHYCYRIVTEI